MVSLCPPEGVGVHAEQLARRMLHEDGGGLED
jgi:hypothetical protein